MCNIPSIPPPEFTEKTALQYSIEITGVELYFGETLYEATTEQNGEVLDGEAKAASWTYPSSSVDAGDAVVKFYWAYDGTDYTTSYQD